MKVSILRVLAQVDSTSLHGADRKGEDMDKENTVLQDANYLPTGLELIIAERERQITQEGWTPEHDDKHSPFAMAIAGACYILDFKASTILCTHHRDGDYILNDAIDLLWPWDGEWWKPTPNDPVRQLTKAGALIAAEVDRIQRLKSRGG